MALVIYFCLTYLVVEETSVDHFKLFRHDDQALYSFLYVPQ